MKNVIGIGTLVCDMYYSNNELIGINGGKTFSNIIFNLANMGIPTKIISECGKDLYGEIIIDSLKTVGVDINNIEILNRPTNLFHINIKDKVSTRKNCPLCNSKKWYSYSLANINLDNELIVIDSICYLSQLSNNKVFLDIGYYNELSKLNNEELNNFLEFKFEIINMNNRVAKYLMARLELNNETEINKKLHAKLLIITKGKKGANYYSDNINLNLKLSTISQEIDSSGAGDIFFASTIKDYLNNNLKCDEMFIRTSFENATNLAKEIVKLIGARTYYQKLYQVESVKNKCTCEQINVQ